MCGRFILKDDVRTVPSLSCVRDRLPEFHPRYNIAPGSEVIVLTLNREGALAAIPMRWGLVPSWSDGPDSRFSMINARAETLERKPAFRDAFRLRRAVIPANGYYEWQAADAGQGTKQRSKQPWRIGFEDERLFCFAALWEQWRTPEGGIMLSTTIITTMAIDSVKAVHDRMPVVLTAEESRLWIDRETPRQELERLMTRGAPEPLVMRAVSPALGNAREDGGQIFGIK